MADLKGIRKEIFLTAYSAYNAHIASAFSLVEIMTALYGNNLIDEPILRVDPANPSMRERDRLILSKGHGSLALYVALKNRGFITQDELGSFIKPGSFLGGEPRFGDIPGVEATTGSLGHGLSIGLGMALGNKKLGIDATTYIIVGDGELEEGSNWEAIMSAAHFELNNLTVILDANGIQKMGPVMDTMSINDWGSRFESFGWRTVHIKNGNDLDEVYEVLKNEKCESRKENRPTLVVAHTVKGYGVSIVENNPNWHFKLPTKRELKVFMEELNITEEEVEACRRHI